MEDEWFEIVDADGRRGRFTISAADAAHIQVELDSGERLRMPRSYAVQGKHGAYQFEHKFGALLGTVSGDKLVFPVIAEVLEVGTRSVERERVQLRTTVSTREEVADLPLQREEIEVTRVPVGRMVAHTSAPREEGDTLIVPIYEEVLHVEKRLMLREEMHVKRVRHEEHAPQTVTLRKEEITVERIALDGTARARAAR